MQHHPLDSENTIPEETPLFRLYWQQMLRRKIAVGIAATLAFALLSLAFLLLFIQQSNYNSFSKEQRVVLVLLGGSLVLSFLFLMLSLFTVWGWFQSRRYPATALPLRTQIHYWRMFLVVMILTMATAAGTSASVYYLNRQAEDVQEESLDLIRAQVIARIDSAAAVEAAAKAAAEAALNDSINSGR